VPDEQRRVVSPLQVVDDQDRGGGRAQLVRQRQQDLDAGNRRVVAVGEQPEPLLAEQAGRASPPRVRRTRPNLETVLHHAQRQPLAELVRHPPPDVPPQLAHAGQGLGNQSRLADARLARNPDHRSLVTTESLHAVPEDRELLAAVHPLRRPVDGPHSSNVCPAQRRCLATPGGHMCRSAHHGPFGINVLSFAERAVVIPAGSDSQNRNTVHRCSREARSYRAIGVRRWPA